MVRGWSLSEAHALFDAESESDSEEDLDLVSGLPFSREDSLSLSATGIPPGHSARLGVPKLTLPLPFDRGAGEGGGLASGGSRGSFQDTDRQSSYSWDSPHVQRSVRGMEELELDTERCVVMTVRSRYRIRQVGNSFADSAWD
eukprot:685820-Rhodomonas_salina.1